jgi:hypothetical protein
MSARAMIRPVAIVGAIAIVASIPAGGDSVGSRFLASLRIARPKTVTANAPAPGGARRLNEVTIGIMAETTAVATTEEDRAAPTADSAGRVVGFHVKVLHARPDAPLVSVLGAQTVGARMNRGQLTTLLAEAGRRGAGARVDPSIDGASITLTVPRGVRVQYGNCPAPIANTLQNQIQGPPPPSTDNGNCVILAELPIATSTAPAALDTTAVLEISLELLGMSPNQARDFQHLFGWRAAVAMSPPRFMRSYEVVPVGDHQGMLMITGGRRGPTYMLAWLADGLVYTLTGYGSSADALSLANSAN